MITPRRVFYFVFNFRSTPVTDDVVVVPLLENEAKAADAVPHNYYDPELVNRLKEISQRESVQGPIIPILVIACNRISVRSCLDDLIRYRPDSNQFPIIVSQVRQIYSFAITVFSLGRFFKNFGPTKQDCDHEPTKNVIESFKEVTYMRQPDQSGINLTLNDERYLGYYKIARHYKWALNTTFAAGFQYAIIVEGKNETNEQHRQKTI